MSRSERRAYLHAIAARYVVAQRAQKGRMLDEYCATVRVSRKHAIAHIGRTIKALADEAAEVPPSPRRRTGSPRDGVLAAHPHGGAVFIQHAALLRTPCTHVARGNRVQVSTSF